MRELQGGFREKQHPDWKRRANPVALWGKCARIRVDVGKLELRPHRSFRHTKLDSYKLASLVKNVLEEKQTTADLA